MKTHIKYIFGLIFFLTVTMLTTEQDEHIRPLRPKDAPQKQLDINLENATRTLY